MVRQPDGTWMVLDDPALAPLTKSQKNNRRRKMKKQAERAEREAEARLNECLRGQERRRQDYATVGRS